ncbi:MAG: rhomboid family intramembrane serine protease [Oculatellaceae cyanobacterium bins.114]|nr:rhomboid family intramembrane serine protease [Oculatellaceae cyanobacterium bins.114]
MKQEQIFIYAICMTLLFAGGLPNDWRDRASILSDFIVVTWGISIFNVMVGGTLTQLGIRPRDPSGLLSIGFSPFLHADGNHLFGNTLPFIILGWLVLLQGIAAFYIVTVIVAIASGLGVWLFGRPNTNHLGASGVIFGYLGFLMVYAYFKNDAMTSVVSLFVGFFYWRSLLEIFPSQKGISWEGHLFGLLGGVLAAGWLPALQRLIPVG